MAWYTRLGMAPRIIVPVSILLLICCMFYKTEVAVHFVMCFPDVYEIGMSQGLFHTSITFGLLTA